MQSLAPQHVMWTIRTDVFDGPLDLLLYLVKRDGVDLRTMPITPIANSYLAFLDTMRSLDLTLASGYLLLAATLCRLKSMELLPRPPSLIQSGDLEDPKVGLIRQMEAYERVKQAAEQLDSLPLVGHDTFVREPIDLADVARPWVPGVDAFGLLDAYYDVLLRPTQVEPSHTIHREEVDLSTCCAAVLRALGGVGAKRELGSILRTLSSRAERVVAFLAVLEMTRLGWLQLLQSGHFQPVMVTSCVPVDQDLAFVRGPEIGLAEVG